MNWAVVNERGEVVTIVTAKQGKLPPGCSWVPADDLPADARRAPAPAPEPPIEDRLRRLEDAVSKAGIRIEP